ncbi:uncharacterized protein LOC111340477 isoform X1 [Stylophora pistillata]|uniref:uncharacterized protein LOC111340477 isoform X1 n=1 Tax=Stylophora pistillata TaxID=50429 RepID=UPI000C046860|nr:uncharacterized protein LOC111340477 isoform X1 [Stylophora pistillata]
MFRGKVFPVVFALLLILKLHISMSGAQGHKDSILQVSPFKNYTPRNYKKEVEKTMERGGIEESPKLSKGEVNEQQHYWTIMALHSCTLRRTLEVITSSFREKGTRCPKALERTTADDERQAAGFY